MRCRVSQANGRPIIFLNRQLNPGLPDGTATFSADDEEYEGDFVNIALNVVRRSESAENVLPDLLRQWFGPSAGLPGTSHHVILERVESQFVLRPETHGDAVSSHAAAE